MKRFIKIIFILLIMFLFAKVVNANEATCKYEINEVPHTYKVTVTYNNGAITASLEQNGFVVLKDFDFEEGDFFRYGPLSCPKTIYYFLGHEVISKDPISIAGQQTDKLSITAPLVGETLKPSGTTPPPEGGTNPDTNAEPVTCTPTGQSFSVCEDYETYDASRNLCRQQPLGIEYTNRIKNVGGGYNDYFMDWKMREPTYGKCSADYYYAMSENGEPKCFLKTCIGRGQRRGDTCILCKELTNNGTIPIDNTPIGPSAPPTCADFKEITGPIWFWMKILAPILAIVFGTMDLLKAVAASDDKGTKKAVSDFGKRLALCALLFLLHIIVNMLVGFTTYGGIGSCL